MFQGITVIAEVKIMSPFGYKSEKSWEELFEMANSIGDIISIHTDSRWGGSFDLLKKARNLTKKPILAKGIHEMDNDVSMAIDNGADYILVVGRIPLINQEMCLIEPKSLNQLKNIPTTLKAVWNQRDLETGGRKKESFKEARKIHKGWLCQASHISTLEDIDPLADAILIGTKLENFIDILKQ